MGYPLIALVVLAVLSLATFAIAVLVLVRTKPDKPMDAATHYSGLLDQLEQEQSPSVKDHTRTLNERIKAVTNVSCMHARVMLGGGGNPTDDLCTCVDCGLEKYVEVFPATRVTKVRRRVVGPKGVYLPVSVEQYDAAQTISPSLLQRAK